MIILRTFNDQGEEVHVRYDGHETLETAKQEIDYFKINGLMPPHVEVYEADEPTGNNRLHQLDPVDGGFYPVPTAEEMAEEAKQAQISQKKFEEQMKKLKGLAEEEERKYGPMKGK